MADVRELLQGGGESGRRGVPRETGDEPRRPTRSFVSRSVVSPPRVASGGAEATARRYELPVLRADDDDVRVSGIDGNARLNDLTIGTGFARDFDVATDLGSTRRAGDERRRKHGYRNTESQDERRDEPRDFQALHGHTAGH